MTGSRSPRCQCGLSTWELAIGIRKYLLWSSVSCVSNAHKDHIKTHPTGLWAEQRPVSFLPPAQRDLGFLPRINKARRLLIRSNLFPDLQFAMPNSTTLFIFVILFIVFIWWTKKLPRDLNSYQFFSIPDLVSSYHRVLVVGIMI